jgi:Uma2 family endonuclease
MAVEIKRRLFTVDEYSRMAEAGILGADDRLELIDGEIIEMTLIGRLHAAAVDRLMKLFITTFGNEATIRGQNPVVLGGYSEPQPDLALLRPRADFYAAGHPGPADILLLVEVADTTAASDRRVKVPLYARNGVPEVWLVDLEAETIIAYRGAAPDGYRTVQVARRGDELAPTAFPDRWLAVADMLGA